MAKTPKRKLIEVALPLDAINKASAREKSIRHGHPSTLHLWWARRPLATARAVIFAQMVDDPSAHPDLFPTEKKQGKERKRLFKIIEDLVQWENTQNEVVLNQAREEIWQSWRRTCAENADHLRAKELFDRNKLPAFHDPFAGGGALPLEAQRLGLESYASDLNPVAVLINKAMIEIPPKFSGQPPVNPEARNNNGLFEQEWKGAQGLAEDVRYYGKWMRDEAEKRIGHLYPKIEITPEMSKERPDLKKYIGKKLTIIAWLWARTVKSPNPAFAQVDVPLASTFMLSTKQDKEAYVEPVIDDGGYRFTVKVGKPKNSAAVKIGTKLSRGANFKCLMSNEPISPEYIKSEGRAGRLKTRLMAIVASGDRERVYLAPTSEQEKVALRTRSEWKPDLTLPEDRRAFWTPAYGITRYGDLFTERQLVALSCFADLVPEVRDRIEQDAISSGLSYESSEKTISDISSIAYADAVAIYLAFAVSKTSNRSSTICTFKSGVQCPGDTFSRHALPMSWDYAEANVVNGPSGSFDSMVKNTIAGLIANGSVRGAMGYAMQEDAANQSVSTNKLVSTDPPYYDNIGYADLSDFFYIWLRRALKKVLPDIFATLTVPKAEELVAVPYRHGTKKKAQKFFLDGMKQSMHHLAEQTHPAFPVTIYYAFKQSESDGVDGTTNTGWDTFLAAVIEANFEITGTWPIRTERENRKINQGTNALASSIVLVCRKRSKSAETSTRRDFVSALRNEFPIALAYLRNSNIAPVDLAQASIGPGMAIYTRYASVLDAGGEPLSVREALRLINQVLDETLAEQESDFDADSRFALAWFEEYGFSKGEYGVADILSKAKVTSVSGLEQAGILKSGGGKVRLLKPEELPVDWDPTTDSRLTNWEMVHHLIRVLNSVGEHGAAGLVAKLGSKAESARELCYRLYTICERKKRATEGLAYNSLVQSWPEITRLAQSEVKLTDTQTDAFS